MSASERVTGGTFHAKTCLDACLCRCLCICLQLEPQHLGPAGPIAHGHMRSGAQRSEWLPKHKNLAACGRQAHDVHHPCMINAWPSISAVKACGGLLVCLSQGWEAASHALAAQRGGSSTACAVLHCLPCTVYGVVPCAMLCSVCDAVRSSVCDVVCGHTAVRVRCRIWGAVSCRMVPSHV